jgi:hypothetical protein
MELNKKRKVADPDNKEEEPYTVIFYYTNEHDCTYVYFIPDREITVEHREIFERCHDRCLSEDEKDFVDQDKLNSLLVKEGGAYLDYKQPVTGSGRKPFRVQVGCVIYRFATIV